MCRTVGCSPLLEAFIALSGTMNSSLQGGGVQVSSGKGDSGHCI